MKQSRRKITKSDRGLEEQALKLLNSNSSTQEFEGKKYTFSVPVGPGDDPALAYRIPPFQWTGWDSQFHTIVFAKLGEVKRAREELRSIFANQQPNGFVPHVQFWNRSSISRNPFKWHLLESSGRWTFLPWVKKPHSSAHMQAPLLSQAVYRTWEASDFDHSILKEFVPKLYQHYCWLSEHRDPDGDGLISVIAQSESGLDYSPAYDQVIRYNLRENVSRLHRGSREVRYRNKFVWNLNLKRIFKYSNQHVEDVLINSIYIKSLELLAEMADVTRETSISDWARRTSSHALQSLIEKSYDEEAGLFWNLAGKEEYPVKVKTVISLMPLIINNLPKEIAARIVEHISNPQEFWTKYPVPSTSIDEPAFSPNSTLGGEMRIWRGPLSMNTNWFLVHALNSHGYSKLADKLAEKSKELVEKHGFNEFYNPLTGEPCGANQFGWATLVVDL